MSHSTSFNPFPGLRSFRSDEDYLFFGREEQTLELVARLQRNRFIAVVGTSGRGKSSLVRCGLLSRLQGGGMLEAGAHWEVAVMHPGGDPFRHLAEALLESGLYDRTAEDAVPHLLATLGRSHFGLIQAVRQAALPAGTNFLLVVDQFEEIFRYDEAGAAESEAANDFVAMLREAAAQTDVSIYVVATMRSDFIGDCSRFEGLAEAVNSGEYLIPGLSRDQFKSAIEGPIRVAGGQITPRLLQRLLNDLGEEQDQLPCLQHALMRMWRVKQGRAGATALDLEDYAQVGKMSQALSVHADEVYFGLESDGQRELCAAMFKALTVEGSEKRGIRRPRRLQMLCRILGVDQSELIPVIDAFRDPEVSFLVPPAGVELRDATVIDLSHESLMRVWARLRDWVDEEAKSVGIFRRLSESAALWQQKKTGFYRDPELSIARAWVDTSRPNAAWAEQHQGNFGEAMAFLEHSSEAEQEEARAQEAARQRELTQARALAEVERQRAEQQTRFAARLKWLVRGVGLVAMLAVVAMFFAFAARREAQASATRARESEMKAQAAGAMADKARGQAEKLAAFLLDDFYEELEPTGRVELVGKLAREAVAYFDGLPAELRSDHTRRSRAIALLRLGQAVYRTGKYDEGGASVKSALRELEELYVAGDHSEATLINLAGALRTRTAPIGEGDGPEYRASVMRSVELLRAFISSGNGTLLVRLELAEAMRQISSFRTRSSEIIPLLTEARALLAEGASTLTNLKVSSTYAQLTLDLAITNRRVGQTEQAERLYAEAVALAEKVLSVQPGDLRALGVSARSNSYFSNFGSASRTEAWRRGVQALEAFEQIVRFNPSDALAWNELVDARRALGLLLTTDGKLDEALRYFRSALETAKQQKSSATTLNSIPEAALNIAQYEAWRGNSREAYEMLAEATRLRRAYETERGITGGIQTELWNIYADSFRRRVLFHLMEYRTLCDEANQVLSRIATLEARPRLTENQKRTLQSEAFMVYHDLIRGNALLGKWSEVDSLIPKSAPPSGREAGTYDTSLAWIAIALGKLGRSAEALEACAKSRLADYRREYEAGTISRAYLLRLARLTLADAAAQPRDKDGHERRATLLADARKFMQEQPAEARDMNECRELMRLIEEERASIPPNAG